MATTLICERAPPLKIFMKPRTVLCLNASSSRAGSTPGTGTFETKRKMMINANVKSSFSRMSGWAIALMAAWRSCGLCAGCCLAAAIAFTSGGVVARRLFSGFGRLLGAFG